MNENITLFDDEFTDEPVLTSIDRFACEFSWATIKDRFLCISLASLFSPRWPLFLWCALKGNITNSTAFHRQQTSIGTSDRLGRAIHPYRVTDFPRNYAAPQLFFRSSIQTFRFSFPLFSVSLSLSLFPFSIFRSFRSFHFLERCNISGKCF